MNIVGKALSNIDRFGKGNLISKNLTISFTDKDLVDAAKSINQPLLPPKFIKDYGFGMLENEARKRSDWNHIKIYDQSENPVPSNGGMVVDFVDKKISKASYDIACICVFIPNNVLNILEDAGRHN